MRSDGLSKEIEHDISGMRTRRVWTYWRDKCTDGRLPTWDSIRLMDLYQDTPIMLILDVLGGAEVMDFRYRFVGTTIVQYRWKLPVPDHTGLTYFEARHQYDFREVKAAYDTAAARGIPVLMRRNFDAQDASGIHERLILPVSNADGAVDKLLVTVERLKETKKSSPTEPPLF
jgi:hypothetical protein